MSSSSCESSSLLSPRVIRGRPRLVSHLPRDICLSSKAALVILVWTFIVGAVYALGMNGGITIAFLVRRKYPNVFMAIIPPYAFLAFMLLCYPLSGLLADVCCGRYRAVMISIAELCSSLLFVSVAVLCFTLSMNMRAVYFTLAAVGSVLLIAGISGYQANFIQFGLDQLMDAPSRYSGLFIHWVLWCDALGNWIVVISFAVHYGCRNDEHVHALNVFVASLPLVFFVILVVVLIFTCYKRHWFHSEPGYQNPYKMVCKVLNFARKHKSPIYRSALTYYDDRKPSRMDFAKEQYGGPFTSEQVEDVKTFLRILTVLISISPVYVLEVPTSYFVFPMFSLHTTGTSGTPDCTAEWILFQSGSMKYFTGAVFFTMYIWVVYIVIPQYVPTAKILHRILFGIVLFLLGAVSMFVIDVSGHVQLRETYLNSSLCIFQLKTTGSNVEYPKTLDLPWPVLIIPNILVGIGQPVLIGTVLEFISAQSPHSMKGLIVGVFFAIRGCVQLLSSMAILPFSYDGIWSNLNYPLVTNCGFGYFLFTIVVALIGLILFSVVAKRYKYRQRGEDPYGPHIVEQVVSDYLSRERTHLLQINSDIPSSSDHDDSCVIYE